MITLKSSREVELMKEAGHICILAHNAIEKAIRPGVSTLELDKIAYDVITANGATPSFLNYNGYPASICASINEMVIHGIPKKHTILKNGDIISIDIGACYKGYHGDCARTHLVGEVDPKVKQLVEVTKQSFFEGLKFARPNNRLSDISHGIEEYVKQFGYSIDKISEIPDSNLLILSTGTQGEPMSALTRMSTGGFSKVKIGSNDTIIISGSPIPGNEKDVYSVINNLYRLGAEVIYDKLAAIHVSGHACREELKLIHTLLKPKFFIPVHGEYRHLKQHADLACLLGMDYDSVVVPEIGNTINVTVNKISKGTDVKSGGVLVDGLGVGDVGNIVLRDRIELSEEGILLIVVGLDRSTGTITHGPEIISRGFIYTGDENNFELIEDLRCIVTNAIKNIDFKSYSLNQAKVNIVKAVRLYLGKAIKRKPMILPIIYEN